MNKPSVDYLRSRFHYDLVTLTWKPRFEKNGIDRHWNSKYSGQPAGTNSKRYMSVGLDGKSYLVHRIIWAIMTGEYPPDNLEIDHVDRDRRNNSWDNLRLATHGQNMMNKAAQRNNVSGVKGVHLSNGRWCADIWSNHRQIHLGSFNTAEEAFATHRRASETLHGDFGCTNFRIDPSTLPAGTPVRVRSSRTRPEDDHRRCSHCGQWKDTECFSLKSKAKLGLQCYCRECAGETNRRAKQLRAA